ncbi:hypothetical protein QD357_29085 [Rhizobium sp. BR 317]
MSALQSESKAALDAAPDSGFQLKQQAKELLINKGIAALDFLRRRDSLLV